MPTYMYHFVRLLVLSVLFCGCSRGNFTYKDRSPDMQASRQAGLFVKEYQLATNTSDAFAVQEAWIERVAVKNINDKSLNEPGYRFCLNLENKTRGISLFDRKTGESFGQQSSPKLTHYTYAGSTINNCIFVDSLELIAYTEDSKAPPGRLLFRSKH